MISTWQTALSKMAGCITLGVLVFAAGCGGAASTSDVDPPSPEAPVAAKTPANSSSPKIKEQASLLPVKAVENSQVTAAREAFQLLIQTGTEPAKWEAAQQTLVTLGTAAAPVLVEGLKSSNPIERETAATVSALSGATDAALQAALVVCLSDSSSFVQANAAAALAQTPEYQPQVMATLTSLLADSDPQLRRMAASNLGSFGAEASAELPKLTAVLADNDAEVVTPVIQLLGRIGPQAVKAVPQLQKIAFEQDGEIKHAAEQALLLIQSESTEQIKADK